MRLSAWGTSEYVSCAADSCNLAAIRTYSQGSRFKVDIAEALGHRESDACPEIDVLQSLLHPGVLRLHDFWERGVLHILMHLWVCDLDSMAKRCNARRVRLVLHQACNATAYGHNYDVQACKARVGRYGPYRLCPFGILIQASGSKPLILTQPRDLSM